MSLALQKRKCKEKRKVHFVRFGGARRQITMNVLLTRQWVMKEKENEYFFNSCFVSVFCLKDDYRNEEERPNTSKWELTSQIYEEILQCFCILYEFISSKLGELYPRKMRALVRCLKDRYDLKILKTRNAGN